METAYLNNNTF